MITQQDIKQALQTLTSKLEVDFTKLPVIVTDDVDIARTDFEYIYLSDKLRVKDLPTVIAHEVMHFLTGSGELDYKYGSIQCNIAEDLIINQWLKLYGLDVTKLSRKGLLDSKPWSLTKRLSKLPIVNQPCVSRLVPNELMRCAIEISHKKRFRHYSLLQDTLMDEVEFAESLVNTVSTSLPINLYAVMRFWFDWLYKEDQINTDYVLNTEYDYSHLICWGAPKWSRKLYDDPALAISCTSMYLSNVAYHTAWLVDRKRRLQNSFSSCQRKISDLKRQTYTAKIRKDLNNAIRRKKSLKYRIKYFDTRGADYWLTNTSLMGRYYSTAYTPTLFHKVNTPDDCIPYSKCPTPLYKQLGWCLRQAVKNNELCADLYNKLEEILGEMKCDLKNGQPDLKYPRIRSKIADILNINRLARLISKILKLKGGFDSTLKLNRSKPSDNSSSSAGYTLGSDISNAVISELGLLANECTKLDFLVKLSQGSLFQVSSMVSKRLPLIMYIDTSGSMSSQGRFSMCIAYALSIATILKKEKRGVAIVLFDDYIRYSKVIDDNYSMADLLDLISAQTSGGGTNFELAYKEGKRIQQEQGWGNSIHVVMSDSQFVVPAEKQPNDQHYALLFKPSNIDANMQSFFDKGCWQCSLSSITKITLKL